MGQRLTSTRIAALRSSPGGADYADRDCPGLLLHVGESGTKSWQFRYYFKKKRTKVTFGVYPTVGILRAHHLAHLVRDALEKGIDPRRAGILKRAAIALVPEATVDGGDEARSVGTLVDEYLVRYVAKRGKDPEASMARVGRALRRELAAWLRRDARTIAPREVVALLDGVVDRGHPVAANRLAGTLNTLFKLGVQRALVDANPVQILVKPGGDEKPRDRTLTDDEVGALLRVADDVFTHARRTPVMIRLALWTGCRRSELALATWDDFDLENGLWVVPERLSKTGVKYYNPLVHEAVIELKRLKVNARGSRFVFPAKFGGDVDAPADPMILTRSVARNLARLRARGIADFTLHDLRRTVRTGLARLGVEPHVAERVLNHSPGAIARTYDLHHYIDQKREALTKWAAHLAALKTKETKR